MKYTNSSRLADGIAIPHPGLRFAVPELASSPLGWLVQLLRERLLASSSSPGAGAGGAAGATTCSMAGATAKASFAVTSACERIAPRCRWLRRVLLIRLTVGRPVGVRSV